MSEKQRESMENTEELIDEREPGGEWEDAEEIPETEEEEEETELSGKKTRRHSGKRTALWVTGGIALFLALVYLGTVAYFRGHFFPNTTLNGSDCSGKNAAGAAKILEDHVDGYALELIPKEGEPETIRGSEIGLVTAGSSEPALRGLLEEQNAFIWPAALFSEHEEEVRLEVSFDAQKLEEKVGTLALLNPDGTESVSAYPKYDGNEFVVEPEVYGTKVDAALLTRRAGEAVSELLGSLDLEEADCYSAPKYTADSPEVQAACDQMNGYCKASITYTMGEDVVLDKDTISGWLRADENMSVTIDENAIRSWLEEFGNTYDTVGVTRNFTTPEGKEATVSGGTYGWSINEDTEFDTILDAVKTGKALTKEPAYYIGGEAASHTMPDWGTTFAEVDLTRQHMWYVKDGTVQLETDVVTGEPIPEKITPEGVYTILEKSRNATLIGATDPATGQPSYRTPVAYWMRVTWSGIGFHDANWQPAFGGTLNQITGVGSHGCINMPVDQAAALYDLIEVGTPVIIHY